MSFQTLDPTTSTRQLSVHKYPAEPATSLEHIKEAEMDSMRKGFQRELRSLVEGELKKARQERLQEERRQRYQVKVKMLEEEK